MKEEEEGSLIKDLKGRGAHLRKAGVLLDKERRLPVSTSTNLC